ncbi:hypothetical protein TNCV_3564861 [Trichonephila clavipes]|nr:hypothetical protein TNCV_3564861 [Trichonephila clavipes]
METRYHETPERKSVQGKILDYSPGLLSCSLGEDDTAVFERLRAVLKESFSPVAEDILPVREREIIQLANLGSRRGDVSCNCPSKSIPGMLNRDGVWRSNSLTQSVNIWFQDLILVPRSTHSASCKDKAVCAAIHRPSNPERPLTHYLSSNVREIDHYDSKGLIVWTGVTLVGCYDYARGTVTAVRYTDKVLKSNFHLFTGKVAPDFILMDDTYSSPGERISGKVRIFAEWIGQLDLQTSSLQSLSWDDLGGGGKCNSQPLPTLQEPRSKNKVT